MASKPKLIELADGTKINSATGEVVEQESEEAVGNTNSASTQEKPLRELALVSSYKVSDLPERGKLMSVISAIVAFELWGLPPNEIAKALGTEQDNIIGLQASDAYIEFKKGIMNNVMTSLDNDVRGLIAKKAHGAVTKIIDTLEGRSKSELPLKAANSLLDRGGFGPKSTVDHIHRMEDELVIRVIKDTGNKIIDDIEIGT